jgi:DNA invertase Pin-like site-specific DNA recombinase
VHEYVDRESGRKNAKGRKQFAQLFEDAHKCQFDCVLFWALDRFTREGMTATIGYLQRLASYGVAFHSYTEAHLSTDNELVGNILLAVMSSLAEVESQKIGERTRASMARARAQGKRIAPSHTRSGNATKNRQTVERRTERVRSGEATWHRRPYGG